MQELLKQIIEASPNRDVMWEKVINDFQVTTILELGVYRGNFAQYILQHCPKITAYYMLDPWRHLDDWNKPANTVNDIFEQYYQETLEKTDNYSIKRHVLRGKTTEVIHQIENHSLDFAYIDGDHTLKGITIDLINTWPKIRKGGWIGGDDFKPSIWQHHTKFEPTLIFPFAVYFAEAVNSRMYALSHSQFLIEKNEDKFEFIDLTNGKYRDTSLLRQFSTSHKWEKKIKRKIIEAFPGLHKVYKKNFQK